jgi:hypothetical protein
MTPITVDCPLAAAVDRIPHAAAQAELRASSYMGLRRVCCCVCEGRMVLCGIVPSYYLKQVAQCVLQKRLGTDFPLDNRLKLASRPTSL